MMDIDKIRDEMAKKHDHPGVVIVGEYVTSRVTEGAAIPKGKTLEGAFDEIQKYAKTIQKRGFAYVPPEKAYEIVDKYFGFGSQAAPDVVKEHKPLAEAAATTDDLDLDKLLGEW